MKICLSIAGSDCSGGAGIQADLKTFSAHCVYGMTAVTSVVAENANRVISIQDIDLKIIEDQIDACFEDFDIDAIKIGMLSNGDIMKAVAKKLDQYKPKNVVIDPVMIAQSGQDLMQAEAMQVLREYIVPHADLLTPNIPEAEELADSKIHSIEDVKELCKKISKLGAKSVLIKGGHSTGDAEDILYHQEQFYSFTHERIKSNNTHGTGCTLSSAIAANLANNKSMQQAVEDGKEYVTNAIIHAEDLCEGDGPTNHLYEICRLKGM